jgi:hypothetical protein
MKSKFKVLILLFLFLYACSSVSSVVDVNDEYLMDLAKENYRLGATMYLDEFDEDLSSLTYDFYINYVEEYQAPAAENLSVKIKAADQYDFLVVSDGFIITLLYKTQNRIIGDDSRTALIDTVIFVDKESQIFNLNVITKNIWNRK